MMPFGDGSGGEVIWLAITAEPGCGETDMTEGIVVIVEVGVGNVGVSVVEVVVRCRGCR